MQQIQQLIRKYFKGKQVILSADCCYSGSLNLVADSLAKSGIECLVYSSALESNSSTGAWTFTQSLCEILEGKPYISTKNKNIDLKTAADYIDYNMVYGEYQKSNFYTTSGFPKDFVLSPMNVDFSTKEHIGEIKKIPWSDSYSTCKIIDKKGDKFELHYFDSDVKLDKLQSYEILKNIEFIIYSVDEKIKVEWEHKYYPAVILKRDGFFHYIKYEGYGEEWNEWVASDRIKKE